MKKYSIKDFSSWAFPLALCTIILAVISGTIKVIFSHIQDQERRNMFTDCIMEHFTENDPQYYCATLIRNF